MTIIRLILGYLAAVLIMVALGVIAQSLFVLSGLKAVGAAIGLMEGVAMIVDDLMGLGPNYAIFIALGFAIALPVAALRVHDDAPPQGGERAAGAEDGEARGDGHGGDERGDHEVADEVGVE